jgi:hypothetical protein
VTLFAGTDGADGGVAGASTGLVAVALAGRAAGSVAGVATVEEGVLDAGRALLAVVALLFRSRSG